MKEGHPCVMMFHAANPRIVKTLIQKFQDQGRDDIEAFHASRLAFHEEEGMRRIITMGRQFPNVPIYFVHISIASGPSIVAQARSEGLRVYGETLPQLMTHTKRDFPNAVLADPYPRELLDNRALWDGIHSNGIHAIGTDHEVSQKNEFAVPKEKGFWEEVGAGAPGTETMLSVMLSEGVHKNRLRLPQLVQLMCLNPASIFSLYPKKGVIQIGSDGDIVLVDLKKERKVTSDILHSAGDASFYEGWTLKGWPILTISRGSIVMKDGDLIGKPGYGQPLFRKKQKNMLFKKKDIK
jgi:dihydropyrimidinase